ncbi:MAG: DUF362 domain-containing protein [Deltaproteobacteria bacterium]|nr:DUF362 domain-containing protein [Deltaproteobacteria bacterium]
MDKPIVAIGRYERSPDSLRRILDLCEGFRDLTTARHVVIKPNLVGMDGRYPMPLYGVFTTTRLVHDMVILLKEHGVEKISIAEGSVKRRDLGVGTEGIYEILGYSLLARQYGVKLVDLLQGPFEKVDFGGFHLEISRPLLDAEFLINMPALKTHNQAVLSLGFKNLKGGLSLKSRKYCHGADETLDHHLSLFLEKLHPHLTVLDGIYGLEKGPFYLGNPIRMNTLAASTDPLAAELVGAHLAGIHPETVPHIRKYADRHGRSLDLQAVTLKGEPFEDLRRPIKWDNTWREDNTGPRGWDRIGIRGVSLPKYDKTLCTGCSAMYGPVLVSIMFAFKGVPFDEVEILTGKAMTPSGRARKTLLLGNCMIKKNRNSPHISEAVIAKGCPPSMEDVFKALAQCGIPATREHFRMFRESLMERYKGKEEFDDSLYYLQ